MEGAGEVVAAGRERTALPSVIGHYAGPMGSYAELAAVPADRVVSLPDGVSCEVGAAAMIQGITAHYLAHGSFAQGYGYGLIHAGAGAWVFCLFRWPRCAARGF